MKGLFVLCAVVACGAAQYQPLGYPYQVQPLGYYAPSPYAAAPAVYAAPAAVSSQYHSQDELGQFTYGYSGPLSAKSESRRFDGATSGSWTYIDANGELQTARYTADDVNGFQVQATNLPQAPVADLKAPEFNLAAPVFDGVAPEPVEETAEVKAARAEHERLFAEAAAAADAAPDTDAEEEQPAERRRRSAVILPALTKATFKTASLDPVEADTPADTTLLELKEKEHETYVHTAYAAPVAPIAPIFHAPAITYSAPVVKKVEVKQVATPITYAAAPIVRYAAPAPVVTYSAPVVKTVELKKAESPIAYATAPFPYAYSAPFIYNIEPKAAEEAKPAEEKSERRRRSAVILPALAKATFKTASLDPVEADTPADTTLLELKEKEHETYVHTAYAAPIAPVVHTAPVVTYSAPVVKKVEVKHVATPLTYAAAPLPLTYGAYPYGFGTPLVYSVEPKTAEPAEEKAE